MTAFVWSGPLAYGFWRHALVAGTLVAATCGALGPFLVLRAEVFAADALGHVGFTSVVLALALGASPTVGVFIGTLAVAVILGVVSDGRAASDVSIGAVFAWLLGIGALALSIYASGGASRSGGGASALFGSIYGLNGGQLWTAALVAVLTAAALLVLGRPLLLASLDPAVARARGVPVRLLGLAFLVLIGGATAEATQLVGGLLALALLAGPAGAAVRLTDRPGRAVVWSVCLAMSALCCGLTLAWLAPSVPPSTAITLCVAAVYLAGSNFGAFLGSEPSSGPKFE